MGALVNATYFISCTPRSGSGIYYHFVEGDKPTAVSADATTFDSVASFKSVCAMQHAQVQFLKAGFAGVPFWAVRYEQREIVLEEATTLSSTVKLGYTPMAAGCSYPPNHWYVELPSGLRHWFGTLKAARASQYWPRSSGCSETLPDVVRHLPCGRPLGECHGVKRCGL